MSGSAEIPRLRQYLFVSGNFMTDSVARHIARQYTSEIGEVMPGFRVGIGDEEEFTSKYYFDFIWLTLDGQIPEEPPVAGGARGFIVDKHTRQVQVLTHGDYTDFKNEEKRLTEIYHLLTDFKNGQKRLTELKAKFNLNSKQLLELSKVIGDTELSRERTQEITNSLLDKIKNYR